MSFSSNEFILWSDQALLVINKPAGLLSLPDGYDPYQPHLRSLLEPEFGRLWIVHRLDRQTSGVIALARDAANGIVERFVREIRKPDLTPPIGLRKVTKEVPPSLAASSLRV